MCGSDINLWDSAAHALEYLARADSIPHRTEGEAELLEWWRVHCPRAIDSGKLIEDDAITPPALETLGGCLDRRPGDVALGACPA